MEMPVLKEEVGDGNEVGVAIKRQQEGPLW